MDEIWKALESVGTFLLGLAAIAGGIAAIRSKATKLRVGPRFTNRLRALSKSRLGAVGLTAIIIGAVLVFARFVVPHPCSPTNLSIISPKDGAVVGQSQPVIGTINHLCPGQHLWLVLQPSGGGYYPQNDVAVASNAERWSTAAYFGRASRSDDSRPFTLLAAVADDSTNRQFQEYLASGKATQDFPGLADLGGAAVVSEIKVIRGPYLPP